MPAGGSSVTPESYPAGVVLPMRIYRSRAWSGALVLAFSGCRSPLQPESARAREVRISRSTLLYENFTAELAAACRRAEERT